MYAMYNPNPIGKYVGDCVIRAICKVTNESWDKVYIDLCLKGLELCDMPSSNAVWGEYLKDHGFEREVVPNTCPDCYTVAQFCADHPDEKCIVCLSSHVVAVENGNYYDIWDSGNEIPQYYWKRKES